MNELPYYKLPHIPEEISTTNTIARLVDGLGFRYRWATEDFTEKEIDFRISEDSMTMMELMQHIYSLAYSANKIFGGSAVYDKNLLSFEGLRSNTLHLYADLSTRLKEMTDTDLADLEKSRTTAYPFWYWLNGPLADALTHVGQITSWRRVSGNPQPKGVDVFRGTKTED